METKFKPVILKEALTIKALSQKPRVKRIKISKKGKAKVIYHKDSLIPQMEVNYDFEIKWEDHLRLNQVYTDGINSFIVLNINTIDKENSTASLTISSTICSEFKKPFELILISSLFTESSDLHKPEKMVDFLQKFRHFDD